MGYTKTLWAAGDVITAEKLNNIESQLENLEEEKDIIYVNYIIDENDEIEEGENYFSMSLTPDKTFDEVLELLDEGKYIIGNFTETASDPGIYMNYYGREAGKIRYCLHDSKDNVDYYATHEKLNDTETAKLRVYDREVPSNEGSSEGNNEDTNIFTVNVTSTLSSIDPFTFGNLQFSHGLEQIQNAIKANKKICFFITGTYNEDVYYFSLSPSFVYKKADIYLEFVVDAQDWAFSISLLSDSTRTIEAFKKECGYIVFKCDADGTIPSGVGQIKKIYKLTPVMGFKKYDSDIINPIISFKKTGSTYTGYFLDCTETNPVVRTVQAPLGHPLQVFSANT